MTPRYLAAICAVILCCAVDPLRAAGPTALASRADATAHPAAAPPPCRLLLDNDDGIFAPGIHALYAALKDMCTIVVVAPAADQSGMSHAVPFFGRGLSARTVVFADGVTGYAVNGTPAEAAALGILALSGGEPFDLLVSGINDGENTGLGNLYSGTVNAGMEALVRGVPAVAFSASENYGQDFSRLVPIVRSIVRQILDRGLPPGVMLNVNIPKDHVGIAVLPSRGLSALLTGFTARPEPNGDTRYIPVTTYPNPSPPPGGDVHGYLVKHQITITPLAMDRTATDAVDRLKGWIPTPAR